MKLAINYRAVKNTEKMITFLYLHTQKYLFNRSCFLTCYFQRMKYWQCGTLSFTQGWIFALQLLLCLCSKMDHIYRVSVYCISELEDFENERGNELQNVKSGPSGKSWSPQVSWDIYWPWQSATRSQNGLEITHMREGGCRDFTVFILFVLMRFCCLKLSESGAEKNFTLISDILLPVQFM